MIRPSCAGALRERSFPSNGACRFPACPTVALRQWQTLQDRLRWLADRLAKEEMEILWVDCSSQGSSVKAVKTIVPGLESETMSYHRIGWRGVRRLRERGDPLLLDARARRRAPCSAAAGG